MHRGSLKVIAIVVLLPIALAIWGLVALNASGPSHSDLLADVDAIDKEIAEASASALNYGEGSALRSMIDLRLAVLSTTRAMLDQKRRSWLRGIELTYVVDGRPVTSGNAESIADLKRQQSDAIAQAEAAEDRYSGGALQVVALMEAETIRATAAILGMRIAAAQFGLWLPGAAPTPGNSGGSGSPVSSTIDDEGAL